MCSACGTNEAGFYPGKGVCKSCLRIARRARYAADPARERATQKIYERANPQRIVAIKSRHYDRNRTRTIERSRQWVLDNPEKRRTTWEAWYARNPESRHQAAERRRAAKLGAETFLITARDWRRLMARYGGLCVYCRTSPADSKDHVIPLSRGGRHGIGNLVPCCMTCNRSKKDRLLVEWRYSRHVGGTQPKTSLELITS